MTGSDGSSSKLSLSVHDDVPEEDAQIVNWGLDQSNAAVAPLHEVRPLSCFVRTEDGAVVGGAIGRTWGECCLISWAAA